jgi:hypothetical protein
MLPSEDPSAPGPVPESIVRRIVDGEVTRIKGELEPPRERSERIVRVEMGHCLLGSGPPACVQNIAKEDGVYQRCNVAYAAMTRRWHRFVDFSAKYLKQGGCPLPDSLGPFQRHLWLNTCYLADGREHTMKE